MEVSLELYQQNKVVTFNNVSIRHFKVSLADHTIPSTGGAPIGIVGKHTKEETINLDIFEATKPKRTEDEIYVSRKDRMSYLIANGITTRQIGKQANKCEKIQKVRQANLKLRGTFIDTTIRTNNDDTTTMTESTGANRNSVSKSFTLKMFQKLFRSKKVAANSVQ